MSHIVANKGVNSVASGDLRGACTKCKLSFFLSVPSTASGPLPLGAIYLYFTIQPMRAEGTIYIAVADLLSVDTGAGGRGHCDTTSEYVHCKIICNEGIARSEAFLQGIYERLRAFGRWL